MFTNQPRIRGFLMVEINAARIIRDSTQHKFYVIFTDIIFEFVSSHSILSSLEKLIWLNLARKSNLDPNYSCKLTQQQIASMVNVSYDTAYRALRNLKKQGFLQVCFDDVQRINIYTPILPTEGLVAIENAPNRVGNIGGVKRNISTTLRSDVDELHKTIQSTPCRNADPLPVKLQGSPCKISGSLPAKMQPLLINNKINNKHYYHNKPDVVRTTMPQEVKNAEALICDFENLQKQYQNLRLTERMKQVNSHFTQDEMQIISSAIIEKQKIREFQQHQEKLASVEFQNKFKDAKPVLKERAPHMQIKLIEFEFEGEHFLIEEAVKNQIMHHIPELYHQQKIKGEAGEKPLKILLKEIFYYVTKAGSMLLAPVTQLKRYYIARKICLKGDWERPKGMTLNEAICNESKWHSMKLNEMRTAGFHLKALGCH